MPMNFLAVDLETDGLYFSKNNILTVAASWRAGSEIRNKVWIVSPVLCEGMHEINGVLQIVYPDSVLQIAAELGNMIRQCDRLVFHNGSFDLPFMLRDGLVSDSLIYRKLFDTMLAARMTGPRDSLRLADLLNYYAIGPTTAEEKRFYERMKGVRGGLLDRDRKGVRKIPTDHIVRYNKMDTDYTLLLAERLWKESSEQYSLDEITREHDFVRVVSAMTVRGQPVDVEKLVKARSDYGAKIRDLRQLIYDHTGAESEAQGEALGRYFARRPWFHNAAIETDGGTVSFAKKTIPVYKAAAEDANDGDALDVLGAIQSTRSTKKALDKVEEIAESLDGLNRVHGGHTVGRTVTYRLASSKPNVQNLPRTLDIWGPFLEADYSQAELRFGCLVARDPVLAAMYAAGEDVHTQTAFRMFGNRDDWETRFKYWRQVAKAVNFLSMYGGGADRLRDRLQEEGVFITRKEAQEYKALHRRTYPKIYDSMTYATTTWEERGYLRLWDGARIYLPDFERDRAYKAFNNVVQGGIAKIVQVAMTALHDEGYPVTGQVHDSIRFDVKLADDKTALDHIVEIMSGALPLSYRSIMQDFPPMQMAVDIEVKGNK